jgi:hypothetical protein
VSRDATFYTPGCIWRNTKDLFSLLTHPIKTNTASLHIKGRKKVKMCYAHLSQKLMN